MNDFVYLGDVAQFRNGLNFSKDSHGKGCLLIGVSDFKDNFKPQYESVNEINPDGVTKEQDYLKKGDLIFVRSNGNKALVGRSMYIDKDVKALYSGFCIRSRLITDTINPLFLAYFAKSFYFRKSISHADGTNINNLNQGILSEVKVPLLELDIQKNIANTLSYLDKKIELNNKINAELEAMAKLIYDYWFVQFDFPDANGKPYKSSGGKMIYNEELKREIPDGWEVNSLADWIGSDKTGDWGKESKQGHYSLQVDCIRGADINGLNGKGKVKTPNRFISQKNQHKILSPFELVVEISGGSPKQSTGRMVFLTPEVFARFEHPLICSNFCKAISLRNNAYFYNFVYQWNAIYDNGILFGWEGKTSGIKNLLFDSFVSRQLVSNPSEELANHFYETIVPIQQKKQKALKENAELESLRDWLLPMLMNGQVTVRQ